MQMRTRALQVDAVLLIRRIAGIDGVFARRRADAVQYFLAIDLVGMGALAAQDVARFFRVGHAAVHTPVVDDLAAA